MLQSVVLDESGAVLRLGRQARTASAAQRRALAARDRGCVIPGCRVPVERTDAHHVRWWSLDGETDIENLALLCGRHHDDVHAGVWTLQMIDGVCWAVPPGWMVPGRPRLRNTAHHAGDVARRIADQLAIPLDDAGRGGIEVRRTD
jgi:hypothetical protein